MLLAATTLTVAFASQAPVTAGKMPVLPGAVVEAGPNHEAFLQKVAEKLGIPVERLTQAMKDARSELGIPEGKSGPGHRGGPGVGRGMDAQVVAQAIGITVEQLKQELPGKSLTQVAQAHGRNPADVATALKNAANKRIGDAVAAGRMTAEQGAQAKRRAAEQIDRHMDQVMPQPGEDRRGKGPR